MKQRDESKAMMAPDEAEIHLETLISTASDAILTMDEQGHILTINPAGERIFGYSEHEVQGKQLTILMPERFRSSHETGLARYLRTGQRNIPWNGLELPGLTKDGREIPLEISFGEYQINGRHIFTGIARDVSERRRAQEEREQLLAREQEARQEAQAANRAKSQFLATMSHEIRTPINAIVGYADLLHAGIGGDLSQQQRDYLDRIRGSSSHLLILIEDILDLSKVEAGQMMVAQERGLIRLVIEAAIGLIRPQAEQRGLSIENRCQPTTDAFYIGDEDRVRQILLNLLSNAAKFTEAGGITISCGDTAELGVFETPGTKARWSWIKVSDTGIGISEDQMKRIFQPFVQADSSNTRKHGGTGLGLTISRKLAWLMGGDLTAESQPGKGSAFTLWLPCEAGLGAGFIAQPSREPRGFSAVGMSVLGNLDRIMQDYVARLVQDPLIPRAAALGEADLQDHAGTFLADIAQSLLVLESSAVDPSLLFRDGTAIQHLVSDLHGAQRCRLGWSEGAMRREFDLLRETIAVHVRRETTVDQGDRTQALELLDQMLVEAERISMLGWRAASAP